jgi:hypothetical protein
LFKETSEAANKTDWLEGFVTSVALHMICLQYNLSIDLRLSSSNPVQYQKRKHLAI